MSSNICRRGWERVLNILVTIFLKSTWHETDCACGNRRQWQMNPTRLNFGGPSWLKSTSSSRLPGLIIGAGQEQINYQFWWLVQWNQGTKEKWCLKCLLKTGNVKAEETRVGSIFQTRDAVDEKDFEVAIDVFLNGADMVIEEEDWSDRESVYNNNIIIDPVLHIQPVQLTKHDFRHRW